MICFQSFTAFVKKNLDDGTWENGVGGRSFLYRLDSDNHFTRNAYKLDLFARLQSFCELNGLTGLAVRGEQYGQGIQRGNHNPHSKLHVGVAFFSTWLMNERRYAPKGHPLYIHLIASSGCLQLPTVPMLEQNAPLTPELIHKYDEGIETLPDGTPFEGVVIQHPGGSFKVINKHYDSKK